MAGPAITSIAPAVGPSSGGDLVRLVGSDIADAVRVRFGGVLAKVESVRREAGSVVVDVRTPAHAEGLVDLEVENVGGTVSVRGTVPDDARLKIARDAVKSVPGVKKVIDLLEVAKK